MSDRTNNDVIDRTVNAPIFQDRCYRRFLAAAISVTNEDVATVSHQLRVAFAGALFNSTVNRQMLAMLVLANATNQTNCLADPLNPGGNILDNDIDFQITSIFTGVASSRSW